MRNRHAQNRAQGAALTPAKLWGCVVFIVPQGVALLWDKRHQSGKPLKVLE